MFNPNISKTKPTAKIRVAKSFPDEAILEEKSKWLAELNTELDMDRHENEILDGPEEQGKDERVENKRRRDEQNDRLRKIVQCKEIHRRPRKARYRLGQIERKGIRRLFYGRRKWQRQ